MNDVMTPRKNGAVRTIETVEPLLTRAISAITVTLLGASAILAFVSVVLRYAFDSSYALVEEMCRFCIVYAVLLYFGPLIMRNAHLRMTILTDALQGRAARAMNILLTVILFLLLCVMLYASIQWERGLINMGFTTMSGEMKAWVPSAALPIGVGIGLLYALFRLVHLFQGDDLPTQETAA